MQFSPRQLDPSKRSEDHLNSVLSADTELPEDVVILDEKLIKEQTPVESAYTVPEQVMSDTATEIETTPLETNSIKLEEARNEAPVLDHSSNRERARLLIFTQDLSFFHEGSLSFRKIADMRTFFLEIHIVVLSYASDGEYDPIRRLFQNVWIYPTQSVDWWRLSYDAYKVAKEQMVFSGGFRADIVIAEDTFESGLAGLFISKKYKRPFQVHIATDFYDEAYIASQEHPILFEWSTKYVLEHASSVRTKTALQRQEVINEREELGQVTELFPHFYTLDAWKNSVATSNLYERYPQYKFIILHISSMHSSDYTAEVISGVAKVLKLYPTIGMVIVGNGPLRATYERLVIFFGLQNQIQFEPTPPEYLSYMKSANVFVHVSEDSTQDELILMAAMAKIPIVGNMNGLAGKLFVQNESALLCVPGDVDCVAGSVNQYLNENQSRASYVLRAHEAVLERIEQNYDAYLASYVDSIERCVAPESNTDEAK